MHEAFNSWPAKFGVLAVDLDAGSAYVANDGSAGDPYVLSYPGGTFLALAETTGGGNPRRFSRLALDASRPTWILDSVSAQVTAFQS